MFALLPTGTLSSFGFPLFHDAPQKSLKADFTSAEECCLFVVVSLLSSDKSYVDYARFQFLVALDHEHRRPWVYPVHVAVHHIIVGYGRALAR